VAISGRNLVLRDANTLVMGATTLSGDASITSGGGLTQTGAMTVAGATTISATDQDVTLDSTTNDFGGVVSVSARNVALRDSNALTLGASVVTGTATLTAGGALTQTGPLTVTGTTGISAVGQDVTLDSSANDFGGAVSVAARTI